MHIVIRTNKKTDAKQLLGGSAEILSKHTYIRLKIQEKEQHEINVGIE